MRVGRKFEICSVMQPSGKRDAAHPALASPPLCRSGDPALPGRVSKGLVAYRAMRAPLVEVRDVLGQNPAQVTFTEDEYVIQALLPSRSHPSLGDQIGSRCSERGAGDTEALEPMIEPLTIAAVTVVD